MATPVRRSATARDDPNGQGEHRGRGPREPRRSVSIRSLPRYLGASPPSPPRARTRSEVFLRTRTARAFPRRKPPPTRLAVSLTPKTSPSSIRRAGELRAVLRTLWSGEYAAFPVRPSSGLLDPAPVSRSRAPRRPRRAQISRLLASRRRPTFRRFNRRRHPFRDRKTRTRFLPRNGMPMRPPGSRCPLRPRSHRFSLHDTDTQYADIHRRHRRRASRTQPYQLLRAVWTLVPSFAGTSSRALARVHAVPARRLRSEFVRGDMLAEKARRAASLSLSAGAKDPLHRNVTPRGREHGEEGGVMHGWASRTPSGWSAPAQRAGRA